MRRQRPDKFILGGPDGHTPVPERNLLTWAFWFEAADRIVKVEYIGPYRVSTCFLGLDQNHSGVGPPVLFETMVFQKGARKTLNIQEQCSTWDQAIEQHDRIAEKIRMSVDN